MLLRAKFGILVLMAILIIIVYSDMGYGNTDATSLGNVQGFLLLLNMLTFLVSVQSNMLTLLDQKPIYLREVANNLYSPYSYFAGVHFDFPFQVIQPLIFLLLTYYPCGLEREASRFFMCYLTLFLMF